MSLKTLVKVSEVNNLSDARYCAGMGVEMLGFMLDENHPKFIELAKLREISIWISGVKTVGEFTGTNIENMNYLGNELNLDYIQINHPIENELISQLKKPVILRLDHDQFNQAEIQNFLNIHKNYVRYFLLESTKSDSLSDLNEALKTWCTEFPIILGAGITETTINEIVDTIKPIGIELKGGNEIKPGLKSFEELSSILELLETED